MTFEPVYNINIHMKISKYMNSSPKFFKKIAVNLLTHRKSKMFVFFFQSMASVRSSKKKLTEMLINLKVSQRLRSFEAIMCRKLKVYLWFTSKKIYIIAGNRPNDENNRFILTYGIFF